MHRSNSLREPLANSAAEIVRARSVAAALPAGLPTSASGLSPDQETLVHLLIEDLPIEHLVLLTPTLAPTFAASLSAPDSLQPCRGSRSGRSGACPARCGLRLNGARLLQAIPGWLVSALVISMGAPIWFEVLARLVHVRAIGPSPAAGWGQVGSWSHSVSNYTLMFDLSDLAGRIRGNLIEIMGSPAKGFT